MVLTLAQIFVRQGAEDAFVTAYRDGVQHVLSTRGCQSVRLTRSVEDPCRFFVIAEWDTVESHTDGFYGSEGFVRWREAVSEFFVDPPVIEHAVEVIAPMAPNQANTGLGS